MISNKLRDLLIEHIDGPRNLDVRDRLNHQTMTGAIKTKLLRTDGLKHPKQTFITEKGRQELAAALADWADALSKARSGGFPIPDKE